VTEAGLEVEVDGRSDGRLRGLAKRVLLRYAPTQLYRRPVSSLKPERLYAYLDALWHRRGADGDVVEVGCYLGGTAAIAYQLLRRTGNTKRYVCVDTFGGFVDSQFARDVELGTPEHCRGHFAENSVELVRRLLRSYDCEEIELVQADVTRLPPERLPERIAVSLVDVDLEVPVYEALRRIVPRLSPGGIVLVDDCGSDDDYAGARSGYARFARENGVPERYFLGMGVVERVARP
jgi:SAM-dependent methyltransferase